MSHELFRLGQKLFDAPQLCTPQLMSHTVEYVSGRCSNPDLALHDTPYKGERKDRVSFDESSKVGYISMDGPITYIPMSGMSVGEGLSHKLIKEEVTNLLEMGASTIVLDQDSGGGEAYQTFETANYIRDKCDEYEAKLVAYVDGISASASYAYTAVAHESIMNPNARVGSIGVVLRLRNFNKRMEQLGVEDTYIFAGESKIPFDAEGDWTEDFKAEMQESVNELYDEFTDHVAMWRGLSSTDVKATQAKMFSSTKAKELGLIDSVMTVEDFKSYLQRGEEENKESNKPMAVFKRKEEKTEMSKLEDLTTQVEELSTDLEAKTTELKSALESVASLEGQLEEALASAETLKTEMAAKQTASRKEKMTVVVGSVKAEDLEDIYSELSDEKFDKFLGGFKSEAAAEEESTMLNELGTEGEPVTTSDKEEKKVLSARERAKAAYSKENK